MANGKISEIDCDAAFYDDRHRRRRRNVGDSRGSPRPRPVTARARTATPHQVTNRNARQSHGGPKLSRGPISPIEALAVSLHFARPHASEFVGA
jgi:hypothetical protein